MSEADPSWSARCVLRAGGLGTIGDISSNTFSMMVWATRADVVGFSLMVAAMSAIVSMAGSNSATPRFQ
jgi:hypothetical protein